MERVRAKNAKFSPTKLQYKIKEVKYAEHIIGDDGQSPDLEKIKAISYMTRPTDRKDVQRLLSMISI